MNLPATPDLRAYVDALFDCNQHKQRALAWAQTDEGRECLAAKLAEMRARQQPQEPTP